MQFLDSYYDNLGLPLYVSDLNSFEIIYINEKGRELFGNVVGTKCYKVLNGTDTICAGCIPADQLMEYGSCCAKARYLAGVDKYVDTFESIITLPDNTPARVCLLVDVTTQERLRQEKEAQERTGKEMQHLIDIQSGFIGSAKSMMSAATLDGDLIFINEAMSEMLGYSKEENTKLRIEDLHPTDAGKIIIEQYYPQALAEGSWQGETIVCRKDGTIFPVRQILFPIKNENGDNIAIATIMDDITKERERELISSYQLAVMNCSRNYISVADMHKKVIYNNPGAFRMLGYEPSEIENLPIENVHPDDYSKLVLEEGIPTAISEGQWVSRGVLINRYGKHIPIEQTVFPVFDESNIIMGVATIIQNISEKVEQEKELEANRRMLRTIIDTTPSAIFWKDKNSRFLGVNKRFASDAGIDDPEKLIGLCDYDFYPKEIAEMYIADDRKTFETGKELFHFEEPFQGADETTHWVSTSKVLIRDENNEPYALLGVYDDITKLKQNEEKLEKAIEEAKEASHAKSDFLSRMSHEIRTPMNAIIGMTRIGQNANDIEKLKYCLEKIDNASKHLLELINDILDMSKIEANKFDLVEEAFNFEKMLESICDVIGIKAEEKQQNLLVNIDENVPSRIVADEMRLSQVITNLLSNAVKFTQEKGTIHLSVSSGAESEDGRLPLSIRVVDNGIGMKEGQTAKLFQSFEQAEAGTSRKYGGTGLGLAISKKIVEMMDGEIGVTSTFNEGSTFFFTVLVKKDPGAHKESYDLSAYQDLRILVVDDAREVLDYFNRVLGNLRIDSDTVDNGRDAVEMFREALAQNNPYQILFVDYLMEEMDGIETTRQIKALAGNSVSVIMVSQTEWILIEEEARRAGVDKFIPKPLFQSPIMDSINQFVFHSDTLMPQRLSSYGGTLKGIKLLLAEDIEINREIVISLLEETGVEIDCAENGEEAVRLFSKNQDKYGIIIMDIQMPVMDGLTATRKIKALGTEAAENIPIIAMTANAFAEDVDACRLAGMADHVSKPIDFDDLVAKLLKYLNPGAK